MANVSPSTLAINSITQCLAAASEAAYELDLAVSQNLRCLLHIAGCEAERVRRAARNAAPKKSAPAAGKKPVKRERVTGIKAAPQPKSRRKAVPANGIAY
ncbi:MAG: hypothetical protein HY765_04435 [Rhodomicrobium sp.]|jgi:hypothetical protein|nr:hypothetical protein [Rhodomicrobium sp.]